MKIIHTSDLHLDSALTTRLDSKKVRERKSELILSFKRIVEEAKSTGAEAVIIAGDLFDSEKAGKRALKNTMDIINASPELSFLYLPGNHEKSIIEDSGITLPDNLKIFGEEWTYFRFGEVNVIGRRESCPDMFSDIRLSENEINVIVLHGELRDRSDYGAIIGKKDIEPLCADYIALGHYHSYSKTDISPRCTAVYCGTPEGRGFDEAGPCGYVTLTIEGRSVTHRFTESAKRTLRIEEIDVEDAPSDISLIYKIENALRALPSSDLVRIKLVGKRALGRAFDTDAILNAIKGSYYYAEIKDETRLLINAEDFKNDISLKGEFIRGVLDDATLTDKEKEAVINLGLSVLLKEV